MDKNEQTMIRPDLHMHSVFSDGCNTPEELAKMAAENGVTLMSLTDHDSVDGIAQMRECASQIGIDFVSGVEISTTWAAKSIHIVGLDFDETDPVLNRELKQSQDDREKRAVKIAAKLESCGFKGAWEGALRYVTNPDLISRAHFARWLFEAGYVPDTETAFKKWLGEGRPAYEPLERMTIAKAVELIHQAGGVAVLAHPGRYKLPEQWQLDALLDEFQNAGGEAIEVTSGSHYRADDSVKFAAIAAQRGFLASTGSDFHDIHKRVAIGHQGLLPASLTPVWTKFKTK